MATAKPDTSLHVENFEGFTIVRLPLQPRLAQITVCVQTLNDLAAKSESFMFVDLGKSVSVGAPELTSLADGIATLKAKYAVEIVLLSEPSLTEVLKQSKLAQVTRLFERQGEEKRILNTKKVLAVNTNNLHVRLEATLDGAIQVALQRWIGQAPRSVQSAPVAINPATDVVSVVEMHVDGCLVQVFLSSAQSTLRAMVAKILQSEISVSDPAVTDGACELLNYLTAFFKQQLSAQNSVVDAQAPQLLQAEEMMAILDVKLPARRVQTALGSFDVWLGTAA